jgi:hypothetical protein
MQTSSSSLPSASSSALIFWAAVEPFLAGTEGLLGCDSGILGRTSSALRWSPLRFNRSIQAVVFGYQHL